MPGAEHSRAQPSIAEHSRAHPNIGDTWLSTRPPQDHYDFGMRAVNTVIQSAGLLKKNEPGMEEDLQACTPPPCHPSLPPPPPPPPLYISFAHHRLYPQTLRAMRDSNLHTYLLAHLLTCWARSGNLSGMARCAWQSANGKGEWRCEIARCEWQGVSGSEGL